VDGEPGLAQELLGATGGVDVEAEFGQTVGELAKAGLVVGGDEAMGGTWATDVRVDGALLLVPDSANSSAVSS
jgi:hypothetical protein